MSRPSVIAIVSPSIERRCVEGEKNIVIRTPILKKTVRWLRDIAVSDTVFTNFLKYL